jgi:hypothetical protein
VFRVEEEQEISHYTKARRWRQVLKERHFRSFLNLAFHITVAEDVISSLWCVLYAYNLVQVMIIK